MAGAGYKLFNTGDVLTAAQVNTYLNEQTVMVFANSTARTTALSGVLAEGMMSYLQDTNAVEVYNGTAWTAVGGGGLSSPLTTKGDVWGYSTTDARIPVGSNGTVLTADSAETLGVKWAAPATPASGLTLITSQSFSAASTINVNDVFSATYDNYLVLLTGTMTAATNVNLRFRVGGADDSTSNYNIQYNDMTATTDNVDSQTAQNMSRIANASANQNFASQTIFYRPFAAEKKFFDAIVTRATTGASIGMGRNLTGFDAATSFTGFSLFPGSGNITGTVKVYGYQN